MFYSKSTAPRGSRRAVLATSSGTALRGAQGPICEGRILQTPSASSRTCYWRGQEQGTAGPAATSTVPRKRLFVQQWGALCSGCSSRAEALPDAALAS